MKAYTGGRRSGKTTAAIKESQATGKYILAMNVFQAREIHRIAMNMKLSIPYPVTLKELMSGRVPNRIKIEGLIVDESQQVLQKLLDAKIHMVTVSHDEE